MFKSNGSVNSKRGPGICRPFVGHLSFCFAKLKAANARGRGEGGGGVGLVKGMLGID